MKHLSRLAITVLILCGVFASMQSNHAAPESDETERVLRHVVLFKFTDDATEEQIAEIETAFAALPSQIDAIHDFEWGVNNSPEQHSKGMTHCFLVTFRDEEGPEYLPHEAHLKFVEILAPVLDDAVVVDYWSADE